MPLETFQKLNENLLGSDVESEANGCQMQKGIKGELE